MDWFQGRSAVILIDSMNSEDAPGTLRTYRSGELILLAPSMRTAAHGASMLQTVHAAGLLGCMPGHLLFIVASAASLQMECRLSPSVQKVIAPAIRIVLNELSDRGATWSAHGPAAQGVHLAQFNSAPDLCFSCSLPQGADCL